MSGGMQINLHFHAIFLSLISSHPIQTKYASGSL